MKVKTKYGHGDKVRDKISGFKGTITAIVTYDTGTVCYGVQGKLDKAGVKPSLKWIDEIHLK